MSTDQAPERDRVVVAVPAGVTLTLHGEVLTAKGPLGSVARTFPAGVLTLTVRKGEAELKLEVPPRRRAAKSLLHTWESHVKNLVVGVSNGFEAKMKSVAAHFPMKVQVKDATLVIENFLGEKHPRTASLVSGVSATVEGDFVVLSGNDIEHVGQSAANIERATRIRNYDPRVFQDGIYITSKGA